MRIREPSERAQLIMLSPIVAPMTAVAVVVFGPIVLSVWLWRKYGPPHRPLEWRRWFAWRPVRVRDDWDGKSWRATWAWLEAVERHPHCGYRPLTAKDTPHD